jgi:predicted nucleic acid-binding protein
MLKVQADVVDIGTDQPRKTDTFVADTNIWILFNYAPMTLVNSQSYRTTDYPPYLKKLRASGAKLAHSSLTLAELAHVIEGKEFDIWRKMPGNEDYRLKHFRRDDIERKRVLEEVEDAWEATKAMSTCIDCVLDGLTADHTLERLRLYPLDGYDAMILAAMRGHDLKQLLTDDVDFVTVKGLTVFTANREAIRLAELQSRLIKR